MSAVDAKAAPPSDILFTAPQIAARVRELATEIVALVGPNFLAIPVLKGSFIFAADLLRALHDVGAKPEMDFIRLSSYGAGISPGELKILADTEVEIAERDVVIVDDILETGCTLSHARELMLARGARSVRICVFLRKPDRLANNCVDFSADFVGFDCPDRFVVGYGMDINNYWRQLPFVGAFENKRGA